MNARPQLHNIQTIILKDLQYIFSSMLLSTEQLCTKCTNMSSPFLHPYLLTELSHLLQCCDKLLLLCQDLLQVLDPDSHKYSIGSFMRKLPRTNCSTHWTRNPHSHQRYDIKTTKHDQHIHQSNLLCFCKFCFKIFDPLCGRIHWNCFSS